MKLSPKPESGCASPRTDVVEALIDDWRRERPDLDASPMAVVGRILTLGRRLESRATQALKPFDLDYSELDVLATLRRKGSRARLAPTDLAQSALITTGAMTACLDRLEERGLVRRERDDLDRRKHWVALTRSGKSLIDAAIGERFREAGEAIAGLKASERRQLAALLGKLAAQVPSFLGSCPSQSVLDSRRTRRHRSPAKI